MSFLETAYADGQLLALQKLGLAQPSLGSVGIKNPVKAPGLPSAASAKPRGGVPKLPMPALNTNPAPSLGQQAAKLAAPRPTHPTVERSSILGGKSPETPTVAAGPINPQTVSSVFGVQEQSKTRIEPAKKLSAEICTTCRRQKHYGPCLKPTTTKPEGVPMKRANFNFGMKGEDARDGGPPTSSRYNSSVTREDLSRSFGRLHPAIVNSETVSIDQVGAVPDQGLASLG